MVSSVCPSHQAAPQLNDRRMDWEHSFEKNMCDNITA